ncbi:MAG: hypothetical protein IPN17_18510 [Deltaproteobacteria bacterium]|nr:hypothetical protein [Deltaproteobacteria bacterium]MBK8694217.1 hypothetical protein [Deltaproteobacteria bacterium]
MLKIRNSQLASLNALVSARLLLAHAQSAHADAAAALGAAKLRSAIDEVVRRCGEYGVAETADQLRLMDLAMIFGADWQRPETAWLDAVLRDPAIADPRLRVRKAWRTALRRLARET